MERVHSVPQETYTAFSNSIHSKVLEKNIPIDGTIELTQRCNLKCVQCYCCHDPSKRELSYDEICRILDEIAEAGCLWLLITGGEPLLRPDFLDIYMYAKKKGFLITLFTNATLVTPEILDHLSKYPPFSIEVSVYGATKEIYEKITGVTGSFESCMAGIKLILDRKLPLKLKTMAMALNHHEVSQMKEWSEGMGIEFRFDAMLHPKLTGLKDPWDVRLSPEDAVALDGSDQKKLDAWREVCKHPWEPSQNGRLFTCGAGKNSFHIDPYGYLRPCDMMRTFSYDLRKHSFREAWVEMCSAVSVEKAPGDYKCRGCKMTFICNQCPGWGFLENGDIYSISENMCDVAQLRARKFGAGSGNTKGGMSNEEEILSKAQR